MAASGPAPDAAAAAPAPAAAPELVTDAFVAAAGTTDAPGTPVPAPVAAPVAAPVPTGLEGLDGLPVLGTLGSITDRVTDGPAAARQLLSTGTGRSLMVIGGLLGAIACFLMVHRRTDRGDRKLSTAQSGPEVARFR